MKTKKILLRIIIIKKKKKMLTQFSVRGSQLTAISFSQSCRGKAYELWRFPAAVAPLLMKMDLKVTLEN